MKNTGPSDIQHEKQNHQQTSFYVLALVGNLRTQRHPQPSSAENVVTATCYGATVTLLLPASPETTEIARQYLSNGCFGFLS